MTAATAREEDRREDHVPRPRRGLLRSGPTAILVDPYNEKVGYPVPRVDASVVLDDELALTGREDGAVAAKRGARRREA
ncbi:MAG TPA: hypothetical protein VKV57_15380 [bacterium]|nr:hypothetical protein [bacterium]